MSVYWIVLKTSIWTQDLLGGFPCSSAVNGLTGWAAYNPPQKPWKPRFLIPKNVNNIVAAGAWKVFSKFAICGVPPPCRCCKAQDQLFATNKSRKMPGKLCRSHHDIQVWKLVESPQINEFTLRRSKKIQLWHRRIFTVRQGKLPRKFLNIRDFSACFLVSNSFS